MLPSVLKRVETFKLHFLIWNGGEQLVDLRLTDAINVDWSTYFIDAKVAMRVVINRLSVFLVHLLRELSDNGIYIEFLASLHEIGPHLDCLLEVELAATTVTQ